MLLQEELFQVIFVYKEQEYNDVTIFSQWPD